MTAPLSGMALSMEHLRQSIADSATFRDWVGATGAEAHDQAYARVYQDALPPPEDFNKYTRAELESYRPFARIWTDENQGYTLTKDSQPAGFWEQGVVNLHLEKDVLLEIEEQPEEIDLRFRNEIGLIMVELTDFTNTAGYLDFQQIMIAAGPHRSHRDEVDNEGDYQWCEIVIMWGLR